MSQPEAQAPLDPSAMLLAPSIMTADFGRLREEIELAEAAGVNWIHLDVMDGRFVPNISLGPVVVAAVRRATSLPLDVHMMTLEPERYFEAFVDAGASHITVHAEECIHLQRQLQSLKDLGAKPGVALNPGTPLSMIEEVLADLDLLLVMSVNPGFGGQSFLPATPDKIRRARRMLDAVGSGAHLQVDGGINVNTIRIAAGAGATVFVTGAAVYNDAQSVDSNVRALREALSRS